MFDVGYFQPTTLPDDSSLRRVLFSDLVELVIEPDPSDRVAFMDLGVPTIA